MGWENWEQSEKIRVVSKASILRESFYIFTLTLLSLLLPLSFLLLARLSRVKYFLTIIPNTTTQPVSYLLSLFLYTNPTLLHLLVSFVTLTALVQVFTGKVPVLTNGPESPTVQPRLYTAWIMLCTLQVCVGLGIEGTIAAGAWAGDYDGGKVMSAMSLRRIVFFIGLHETMAHWSRFFVRPVVDDTVFGSSRDERQVERVVMGVSYGGLWWWRLREEAEGLLLMVDVKGELSMGLGVADLVSWWLYYVTVTIAVVRIAKGVAWVGKVLCCCTRKGVSDHGGCSPESDECRV